MMITYLKKHYYSILVFLIVLLAVILRFINFDTRWGLGNDDSRDVAIALEALRRGELPMIGSFSSAGPFVFGPFFYWFVMLSYIIFPFALTIPWIFSALVGVGTVVVLMYCGQKIAGKHFALLVGLLAATSPQLVSRSLSLGQHIFVAFFASCMMLFFLLYFEKKKLFYSFLVGLSIGTAINFHYQALNLVFILPMLLFIPGKSIRFRILSVLCASAGILLALLPLIWWDSHQYFASFRNLFKYFLIEQYKIYVANSWKLFLFTYLPQFWSFIVGGYTAIGILTIIIVGITTLVALIKKKIFYPLLLLFIPFALLVLLNKFYKGERSDGYLLYFIPFVLLATSYTIYMLFQSGRFLLFRQIVGGGLCVILLIGNFIFLPQALFFNSKVAHVESVIDALVRKYPNQKFSVYDYKGSLSSYNQPLSLLLERRGLIAQDGMPIGLLCYTKCPTYPAIARVDGLILSDLTKVPKLTQQNKKWVNVNPRRMYDDLIGWSQKYDLHSDFYFEKYLTDKLHF